MANVLINVLSSPPRQATQAVAPQLHLVALGDPPHQLHRQHQLVLLHQATRRLPSLALRRPYHTRVAQQVVLGAQPAPQSSHQLALAQHIRLAQAGLL